MSSRVTGADSTAVAPVGVGWRQPHYAELLERRPQLDFLEVHSENFFAEGGAALATLQRARADYCLSLHGVGLSLGSVAGLDPWHLERLAVLVQRVEPVRVSDHACFARGAFGASLVHASDLLPIPFCREALDVLCSNVSRVQDRLGRQLVVENLSSYLRWLDVPELEPLAEPEFLASLARRTGCGLLIDVNNIYVNALNAGLAAVQPGTARDPIRDCREWLDRIPVDSVAEIHLAGHCHVRTAQGEIVIDDHGSRVCDAVWSLYRHAVQRFGPVPALIEWDTDVPELDVLLHEAALARAIHGQTGAP